LGITALHVMPSGFVYFGEFLIGITKFKMAFGNFNCMYFKCRISNVICLYGVDDIAILADFLCIDICTQESALHAVSLAVFRHVFMCKLQFNMW